jgi:hypothetical protein
MHSQDNNNIEKVKVHIYIRVTDKRKEHEEVV